MNRLAVWWKHSALYSLLAGSFFLYWLMGSNDRLERDYLSSSRVIALGGTIFRPCLHLLYRLGDFTDGWFRGSILLRRWLFLVGLLIFLSAVIVIRLTLSWTLAASVALIGLGMMLTPSVDALVSGSLLGRLGTWWLND